MYTRVAVQNMQVLQLRCRIVNVTYTLWRVKTDSWLVMLQRRTCDFDSTIIACSCKYTGDTIRCPSRQRWMHVTGTARDLEGWQNTRNSNTAAAGDDTGVQRIAVT